MDVADNDLDGLTDGNRQLAVRAGKFFRRDKSLGLVTKINKHTTIGDADDLAFDQLTRMVDRLLLLELLEDRTEVDVRRRGLFFSSGRRSSSVSDVVSLPSR